MIITSLKAHNVLKYERLELESLPDDGVIAISGQNESGKSTIGETVCFALFGRTFSLDQTELDKVVYWGSSGCSVSLKFRIEDKHYHIERFLDKEGTHSAKFSRDGEEDHPIARGVEGVADALFLVLGYEYEEFVDSFYLAQREITAPQPHSHTVKAMAGIAALEYVEFQFEEEIAEEQELIEKSESRIAEIDAETEELNIQPDHLKNLENEHETVNSVQAENTEKIDTLNNHYEEYKNAQPDIEALRGSIDRKSAFRLLTLFLAVLLGGFWALLTQMPEAGISVTLQDLVQQNLPGWNEQHLQGTLYTAIAMAVFFLYSAIRIMSHKSRLNELMQVAHAMADTLQKAHDTQVVTGDSVLQQDEEQVVDAEAAQTTEEEGVGAEDESETSIRPSDGEINYTCERLNEANIRAADLKQVIDREIEWTKDQIALQAIQSTNLQRAIYDEQQRLKHAGHLNDEKDSLLDKITEAKEKIATRELANELLSGANAHLSQQFNNDVRDLVSRTLPLFTEGRYEHLQIGENMDVKVFSGDKRDFLDLEEVSSGTQRQIMLALRLALSQELVNRSVEGDQFLFLDEPFAFFDEARTKSSLKVLNDLSDEINQIFVVAQEFPEENLPDFKVHLECSRDIDEVSYPE